MALREAAWFAITLVVGMLSLTVPPPTWSMALLILLGMIALAVDHAVNVTKPKQSYPVSAPAPAVDAPALAIIVVVVILSLTVPPTLTMAFLVLLGTIASAVDHVRSMTKPEQSRPASGPESSSTPSSSSGFKHDVYLSFRGSDTREGFTDHLYHALKDAGIGVFTNIEELFSREEIGSKLKPAIKRSRISIAILSQNYASSKRCLNELVQMWECRESNGQIIIPIFYDVSPFDVRYQAGDFGRSFNLHEIDKVDSNTIETWREVLRQIAGLRGFILENLNMRDAQLLKLVVNRVMQLLKKGDQVVTDRLVGIDRPVQEMMRKLGVAYREGQAVEVQGEDVRVVGICGVPGVGKTTLAKVIFNKMHELFDASSFLEDISLEGVQFSRRKLIDDLETQEPAPLESSSEGIEEIASLCRNAKVLIVLDDVDKDEQLKELAGNRTWFGPGSRIIVTTNKKNVLGAPNVEADAAYEIEPMDHGDAHKLFCKHAFQGDAAEDVSEYFGLSVDIAKAIGGIPSDIVRHASSLRYDRNMDTWKTTLDLLPKKTK